MKDNSILGPNDRPPLSRWIPLSFQHVFAMFGATVLVPLLTGLSQSTYTSPFWTDVVERFAKSEPAVASLTARSCRRRSR